MAILTTLAIAAGVGLLLSRRGGGSAAIGGYAPTSAERAGWVQMQDMPGIEVHTSTLNWTTPAVIHVMSAAGEAAERLGGALQIHDVGQKKRGVEFKPHASHRWGNDLDIAYRFDGYPTLLSDDVDPRVIEALTAIEPWIEIVGVNEARRAAFKGAPFTVATWEGHIGHLHLRLRPQLTVEPRRLLRRVVVERDG